MALKISSTLKLAQLKSLAFQCGVSTSGTKAVLTNRLLNEVTPAIPNYGSEQALPARILSIDMGIRNLAYCIVDFRQNSISNTESPIPEITAWQRIVVSSAPKVIQDLNRTDSAVKEAFDPQTLSKAAYTLVREVLIPFKPTCILVERQRFRSMGSPHILEWTIRVNMFESMLYAVLQTLKNENIWQGVVIPVQPGKVGPFWLGSKSLAPKEQHSRAREKSRTSKSAKLLNKRAKIDLVMHWLETKQMVKLATPEAELTAQAYQAKWSRLPGRKKGMQPSYPNQMVGGDDVNKLDDLADSLLQAMAWIEWEKKKLMVFKGGVSCLDLEQLR